MQRWLPFLVRRGQATALSAGRGQRLERPARIVGRAMPDLTGEAGRSGGRGVLRPGLAATRTQLVAARPRTMPTDITGTGATRDPALSTETCTTWRVAVVVLRWNDTVPGDSDPPTERAAERPGLDVTSPVRRSQGVALDTGLNEAQTCPHLPLRPVST